MSGSGGLGRGRRWDPGVQMKEREGVSGLLLKT